MTKKKIIIGYDGTKKKKDNKIIVDSGFYEVEITNVHKRLSKQNVKNSEGNTLEYMAIDVRIREDVKQKYQKVFINGLIPIEVENEKAISKFQNLFSSALNDEGEIDLEDDFDKVAQQLKDQKIKVVIGVSEKRDRNFINNFFPTDYPFSNLGDTPSSNSDKELTIEEMLKLDEVNGTDKKDELQKVDEVVGSLKGDEIQKLDEVDESIKNNETQKVDEVNGNDKQDTVNEVDKVDEIDEIDEYINNIEIN